MNNKINRIYPLFPFILLFSFLIYFGCCIDICDESSILLRESKFIIGTNQSQQPIKGWYKEKDNCMHLICPPYVNLDSIFYVGEANLEVADTLVKTFGQLPKLSTDTIYNAKISKGKSIFACKLRIWITADVPSLFLGTETGSMSTIHKSQNYKERCVSTLMNEKGEVLSVIKGEIKGRGNASWYSQKKSYLIEANEPCDILNMGDATKWVLIGNGYDTTSVKNKFIYELASRTGLEWTPDLKHSNLYINGEYYGLYLLSEKVELGVCRLNRDNSNCALLHLETASKGTFVTNHNQPIVVENYGVYPEEKKIVLSNRVQDLENLIMSSLHNNPDSMCQLSNLMDIDSWARRYLIDEISGNSDAGFRSSFFYYDYEKDTFYGGPIWDYDASLGKGFRLNYLRSQAFIAQNENMSPHTKLPYYQALMKNPLFSDRVKELYKCEFRPLINEYLKTRYIDSLHQELDRSVKIDCERFYDKKQPSFEYMMSYLVARMHFLDSAWIDNVDYCNVAYEGPTGSMRTFSVPRGSKLPALPSASAYGMRKIEWVETYSGEKMDTTMAVSRDMAFIINHDEDIISSIMKKPAVFMSCMFLLALVVLLMLFAIMDYRDNHRTL